MRFFDRERDEEVERRSATTSAQRAAVVARCEGAEKWKARQRKGTQSLLEIACLGAPTVGVAPPGGAADARGWRCRQAIGQTPCTPEG